MGTRSLPASDHLREAGDTTGEAEQQNRSMEEWEKTEERSVDCHPFVDLLLFLPHVEIHNHH